MGLFGGLLNLGIDAVKMPFSIGKDIINGGETDKTDENVEDIEEDIESIVDGDIL